MTSASSSGGLDWLRRQALDAARGLAAGEQTLVAVLRELEADQGRATQTYRAVVRSLAAALEARDSYAGGHSDAVHGLSLAVARRLGLEGDELELVSTTALLHDIGKICTPDAILHKPRKLSEDEWETMREHSAIGERILRPLPGLDGVADAVRHEHEHWDGSGYPDGLLGEAIPLASRIVLACDAFHALASDRPYREALEPARALEKVRRCAGRDFDPRVVDALVASLGADWGSDAEPLATPPALGDSMAQGELRALLAVAAATSAGHRIEHVAETAADQICAALGATSASVSRWEPSAGVLRTIVNAGELAEGEERRPRDETYTVDQFPFLEEFLREGRPHRVGADGPSTDPEVELLQRLGRTSGAVIPIRFADGVWGELYVTRDAGGTPFSDREMHFLEAVSGQIAAAIGRAELFGHVVELALEDALTGLANRRALDERLEPAVEAALERGEDLSLLVCDLDNLKQINDSGGHASGDEALVRVARALEAAAAARGDAFATRISGDEFCLVLPAVDVVSARALAERVLGELQLGSPPLSVSAGLASIGTGARRAVDLLRAADAAQYTAKRTGRSRVYVAEADPRAAWRERRETRRVTIPDAGFRRVEDALDAVLADALRMLDSDLAAAPPLDRLGEVASRCGEVLDASAWAISVARSDATMIETLHVVDTRAARAGGVRFDSDEHLYVLSDYPMTADLLAAGGSFVVSADDLSADPAERDLLKGWGMSAVLAAAVGDGYGDRWLVELYADGHTSPLTDGARHLRALVREAVGSALGPREAAGSTGSAGPE